MANIARSELMLAAEMVFISDTHAHRPVGMVMVPMFVDRRCRCFQSRFFMLIFSTTTTNRSGDDVEKER